MAGEGFGNAGPPTPDPGPDEPIPDKRCHGRERTHDAFLTVQGTCGCITGGSCYVQGALIREAYQYKICHYDPNFPPDHPNNPQRGEWEVIPAAVCGPKRRGRPLSINLPDINCGFPGNFPEGHNQVARRLRVGPMDYDTWGWLLFRQAAIGPLEM